MLELKNIKKTYKSGEEISVALDDITLSFGNSEFVSILGASGSGKTTLLNIIGGLDKYTSGDLIVDGTSTKDFKDVDWDSYRNGTIGFVFQSYNLISHLSVLDNVKMALSLSGISSKEGDKRAKDALIEVGLEKHINKRPNQLSGGQMQRVAIARALVNNPKILLADEPTGALDTKTSIQIMELIKKISENRLVIMVTHNPELAKEYSDRIINLRDGLVIEDTAPNNNEKDSKGGYREVKTSMSFFMAIKSSLKNLLTKRMRTTMVTIAGSIGIISIGLVLSISSGMNSYIDLMQKDTLSSIPITISSTESTSTMAQFRVSEIDEEKAKELEKSTTINRKKSSATHENKYAEDTLGNGYTFIEYFEKNAKKYYSDISFTTGYKLKVLTKNENGEVQEARKQSSNGRGPAMMINTSLFSALPENKTLVTDKYDVILSKEENFEYPKNSNEMVLVIGEDNSLSEETLTALGYKSDSEVNFTELLGKKFSIISNDNYYQKMLNSERFGVKEINEEMYSTGTEVEIVAILKPKEPNTIAIMSDIAYLKSLESDMVLKEADSEIVKVQRENSEINVLSPSNEKIEKSVYLSIMQQLGGDTTPTQISIYPTTFENRDKVVEIINKYNKLVADKFGMGTEEYEKNSIRYTDMAKTVTDSMSTMINAITVILVAFSAISLVVSSIMIGILTYVSVVERTKEIGIMRAMGARKKDITRIFNAESSTIGLFSGMIGVIIAMLATIPINSAIESALKVEGFNTNLSITNASLLVLLSVVLTFIAGYIPSKMAAKKDPVEALRTE